MKLSKEHLKGIAMSSKEIYRGICSMLRRTHGATAIEIQHRFNLTYTQTIDYLMQVRHDFTLLKNGTKLKIARYNKQSPKRPIRPQ